MDVSIECTQSAYSRTAHITEGETIFLDPLIQSFAFDLQLTFLINFLQTFTYKYELVGACIFLFYGLFNFFFATESSCILAREVRSALQYFRMRK